METSSERPPTATHTRDSSAIGGRAGGASQTGTPGVSYTHRQAGLCGWPPWPFEAGSRHQGKRKGSGAWVVEPPATRRDQTRSVRRNRAVTVTRRGVLAIAHRRSKYRITLKRVVVTARRVGGGTIHLALLINDRVLLQHLALASLDHVLAAVDRHLRGVLRRGHVKLERAVEAARHRHEGRGREDEREEEGETEHGIWLGLTSSC
mmetsp:Transcript_16278/g.42683  ORF Transcript_16278/g.42683 Transcript_16278/m.42683 type:complete len:206 (-) Transcript_16278:11-628(-)